MPKLKLVPPEPPPSTDHKFDEMVFAFIATRDKIEEIEARHKHELANPRRLKELLTERLLNKLQETGQEMARTKYGTVSAATRDTPSCTDPNLFVQYVRDNDAYELLDRRPNATACKEFLKEHGQLPPGVKLNQLRYVNVQRKSEKST
jgi:hypothetical protein